MPDSRPYVGAAHCEHCPRGCARTHTEPCGGDDCGASELPATDPRPASMLVRVEVDTEPDDSPAPGPGDTTPTADPCAICGDPGDHSGVPHSEVMGDGLDRVTAAAVDVIGGFMSGFAGEPGRDYRANAHDLVTCLAENGVGFTPVPVLTAAPPVPPGPEDAPDTAAIRRGLLRFGTASSTGVADALALCDALDAARATITARDSENSRLWGELAQWRTHGPCACDTGPNTEGPVEHCPLHGRRYGDWIEYGETQQAQVAALVVERDDAARLAADRFHQLATVRARTGQEATALTTGAPSKPSNSPPTTSTAATYTPAPDSPGRQ
jgi:hypothetical protein